VILVDLNLILYAVDSDSRIHVAARQWWDKQLSGSAPVGLSWSVVLGFVRISTHTGILPRPMALVDAIHQVDWWLQQPCVHLLHPTEHHWKILSGLLREVGYGANLTMDAHLAALAIEHGCELCSTDTDFSKFPGLRWKNPLRN